MVGCTFKRLSGKPQKPVSVSHGVSLEQVHKFSRDFLRAALVVINWPPKRNTHTTHTYTTHSQAPFSLLFRHRRRQRGRRQAQISRSPMETLWAFNYWIDRSAPNPKTERHCYTKKRSLMSLCEIFGDAWEQQHQLKCKTLSTPAEMHTKQRNHAYTNAYHRHITHTIHTASS